MDFKAFIEIPAGSPIKYEIDEESGDLVVDRFLHTAFSYPFNYGFVKDSKGGDGDPLDVLILSTFPVQAGVTFKKCHAIGVLVTEDEEGEDLKIIAVPDKKVDPLYGAWEEIKDCPQPILSKIKHFFENYKSLEPGKWVKVKEFKGKAEAEGYIQKAQS